MLSFRYSSIFFYTFLCFSAGTSNGAVNPQNETLLARMRRKEPTDAEMIKAVVNAHNKLRGDIEATDMTEIVYSKCLGGIAKEMVKLCDEEKSKKVSEASLKKYGKDKAINAVIVINDEKKTVEDTLTTLKTAAGSNCDEGKCTTDDSVDYAKAISKESLEVGCHVEECKKFKKTEDTKYLTLCLYGPAEVKKDSKVFTKGTDKCKDCKDCGKDPKLCKAPKEFKSTAEGCPSAGGKKKSMGVQSAKPQTVVAVILTAFLSLLLAH